MNENPHRITYPVPANREEFRIDRAAIEASMCHLVRAAHGASWVSGWHHDPATGELIEHNVAERMMLQVGEISEAMEAHRKGKIDDHLPFRLGVEVELADAMLRILDFAGRNGLDLGGAMAEKIAFNLQRPDHKPEARLQAGGKAY